ncbi:hypothetical protein G9A89_009926 [Geosiphon pyriformis]|nr:hypothetical protein G9A89_009926 [Geosiphon pyriformis]
MTKKIPKSTYYNKYGPNSLFTKAAAGTKKITTFLILVMLKLQTYNGPNVMNLHAIQKKKKVFVVYNECIFYSNDDKHSIWAEHGNLPLRKKGNGRSIMVSEFLIEINGRLRLQQKDIENYSNISEKA